MTHERAFSPLAPLHTQATISEHGAIWAIAARVEGVSEMSVIASSVVVQRPVEEVFAFVTDARNNPQWQAQSGLRQTIQTPDGPVGVGTRVIETWRFLGRDAASISEVTEYVLNRRYVRTQVGSAGPIARGELLVEPVAGGTRLTTTAHLRLRGFLAPAAPLFAGQMRRSHATNLLTLKRLLEARPVERPRPATY
jgi:uncharacterized protein YndB with AHSA1/START domain